MVSMPYARVFVTNLKSLNKYDSKNETKKESCRNPEGKNIKKMHSTLDFLTITVFIRNATNYALHKNTIKQVVQTEIT